MDTIRQSPCGDLARALGFKRALPQPEERGLSHLDFSGWQKQSGSPNRFVRLAPSVRSFATIEKAADDAYPPANDFSTPYVCDWYDEHDPANPLNWSTGKKALVLGALGWLTWTVYLGAAIVSPSAGFLIVEFNLAEWEVSLDIALYMIGYAIGPMLFSPISETPTVGRSICYSVPLLLFFGLNFGAAFATTWPTLLVFRFLCGLLASPPLATGAATVTDVLDQKSGKSSYGIVLWVLCAYAAPGLGPLLSTYQTFATGDRRWPLFTLIFITAIALVVVCFALPETSSDKILTDRAARLRKLGYVNVRSRAEIRLSHLSKKDILVAALIRPLQISIQDPSVLYAGVYVALNYALFYLFFASFPIVFLEVYQWPATQANALPYLSLVVGGLICAAIYCAWVRLYVEPQIKRGVQSPPEANLIPGLVSTIFAVIGMWIYTWTARVEVHYLWCLAGVALFAGAGFITLQCLFQYLTTAYPRYIASMFACNDLFRASAAAGLLLAGAPLYRGLGIPGGCSVCAGALTLITPGYFVLWKYGAQLRARSRFAEHDEPSTGPLSDVSDETDANLLKRSP